LIVYDMMKSSVHIALVGALALLAPAARAGFDGDRISYSFKVLSRDTLFGFDRIAVDFEGGEARIVEPKAPAADGRWVWCLEDAPSLADSARAEEFLKSGYRWVSYAPSAADRNGADSAAFLDRSERLREKLSRLLGLSPTCVLVGRFGADSPASRFAAAHPTSVGALCLEPAAGGLLVPPAAKDVAEKKAAPIPPDNEKYLFETMENAFPKFRKVGCVSPNGEVSPFVFKGRLYRMELEDEGRDFDTNARIAAIIRDYETGKIVGRTGEKCYYHSIFVDGEKVYLTGVKRNVAKKAHCGDTILIYETTDLVHWTERELLRNPGWRYYNTTIAKGPDGYVLAIESSDLRHATKHFTMFFATSKDLKTWTFLPYEKAYPKHRYCGGPFLTYCNGWFYLSLVTEMPCERWCTYLFRTKDFGSWESSRYNPFMMWDDGDRQIAPNACDVTPEFAKLVKTHFICNASDLELCEFEGKTLLSYLIGDQRGFYYIAEAWYDGPKQELLERQFK